MPLPSVVWPSKQTDLYELGVKRVKLFCATNDIPAPKITNVPKDDWHVNACAYYRPDTERVRKWTDPGVNICLPECGRPCTEAQSRNWTWPGSVTDREPFGVLAHELGHHCDWLVGDRKGSYFSEYCEQVKLVTREPGLTSYADVNPAEWFAEAFRLFVTNPDLLRLVRPRTYAKLAEKWKPCTRYDWLNQLGSNVPDRIVRTLRNKGAK